MKESILRICDVNCNRAREAMRVLEDYARFTLDHPDLSEQLKRLRHDFQIATAGLQQLAIPHRDTPGDVGTGITTETEAKRESMSSVVVAAGKRLGEALRTLEEYGKLLSPIPAIEPLRYRFYEIEKRILLTLALGRERMRTVKLCVLITESLCKKPWLETARLAIEGGADCLQLREKNLESGELLTRARQIVSLCRAHGVVSIINDRADIAVLSDADGVHIGQSDLPLDDARRLVGTGKIVGVSTHAIAQARVAASAGADYVGVGPVFPSSTKPKERLAGLEYVRQVHSELTVPAIAISGIDLQNLDLLLETGIQSIAVSAAVIAASDPLAAARGLKARLDRLSA